MQNMILLLFAVFFTAGSYFILAEVFKVPTYRTSRAILTVGKKQKKQARSSDAFIMELSSKIARFLPIDEYKKRKLAATLRSAEIPMTPELYMAQVYVKAGLIFVCIIPCLLTGSAFISRLSGFGDRDILFRERKSGKNGKKAERRNRV